MNLTAYHEFSFIAITYVLLYLEQFICCSLLCPLHYQFAIRLSSVVHYVYPFTSIPIRNFLPSAEEKVPIQRVCVDNQTECSTVQGVILCWYYGLYEGCVWPLTWSEWQSGNPQQYLRSQPSHPEIQRNQYWQWDAVWRVVYQYLQAEGGRFINQSCLLGKDCTRALTMAGQEGMSALYRFIQTKTNLLEMIIKLY